jgi:hypothetical protein
VGQVARKLRDLADDENAARDHHRLSLALAGDFNESWSELEQKEDCFRSGSRGRKSRLTNEISTHILQESRKALVEIKHATLLSWSDIDWVLCSDGLLGEGVARTAVCEQRDGAHCPIFITVDSTKGLGMERET